MSDMFPNHAPDGVWGSLKGGMIPAYEAPTQMDIENTTSRVNVPTDSPSWNSTIIVQTPTTTGTGSNYTPLPGHA